MKRAAEKLLSLGAKAVLMKGGHLEGDRVVDLLFHDGRIDRFEDARIQSRSTHGTGCTLASAIAAGLAQKMSLRDAVARARAYVREAIATAPGYGQGHGPLNHAVTVRCRPEMMLQAEAVERVACGISYARLRSARGVRARWGSCRRSRWRRRCARSAPGPRRTCRPGWSAGSPRRPAAWTPRSIVRRRTGARRRRSRRRC